MCIQSSARQDAICVLCSLDLVFLIITSLALYLNHRGILTRGKGCERPPIFFFERLGMLVLVFPAAHRNNVNTLAEQFVFYLQVHLRLHTGHLPHSLLISFSTDLLWNASKLTLSPVFSGGVACTLQQLNFSLWQMNLEVHVTVMSLVFSLVGSVSGNIVFHWGFFREHKMCIHAPTASSAFKLLLLTGVRSCITPQSIYPQELPSQLRARNPPYPMEV